MVAGFTPFFAPWSLLHPVASAGSALVMLATTEVAVTFGAHRRRKQGLSNTAAVATTREGKGKRWKSRLRFRPLKAKPVMDTPAAESSPTPRRQGAIGARSAMAAPPPVMLLLIFITAAMMCVLRLRSARRRAATH
ncbi:unnamed protein product, partial [Pylaiella littoralis]